MTVYIGVDFHPYEQTIAYVDKTDGEIRYRQFLHSDKQSLVSFYRKCGTEAIVGVEATGCLWWFEKLLFENGIKLKIGNPRLSGGQHSRGTRTIFGMQRLSWIFC